MAVGKWALSSAKMRKIQDERTPIMVCMETLRFLLDFGIGAGHRLWASGVYGLHQNKILCHFGSEQGW